MRLHNSPGMVFNRRTFLRRSLGAGAGIWMTGPALAKESELGERPCPPSAWKKHGVILEATEPWEGNDVQNFTTVAEPLSGDRWRLWYSVSDKKLGYGLAIAEGIPGGSWRKFPAQLSAGDPADAPFAIGNLPEKWRPVQVTHVPLHDGRHRIYFWVHGPRVVRYLAAESEDGRRYRVLNPLRAVLYHPSDRAAWGVTSPDGLQLHKSPSSERPTDEPLALQRQISNDATTIYQLPDHTFEMFSVALIQVPKTDPAYIAEDNAPGLLRVIDRYTSADGLHFETRQRVIQRDDKDPPDQQFYYLSQTLTPRGRVGLLGHYRCAAQTMDLEWCFSKDGVQWERPTRAAWLPRGEAPAADCYGIYGNNRMVQHGGQWHLFYTGVNSAHNGRKSHGPPRQVVMYATTPSIWA